ncbi:MAG: hypothetical protein P4L53_18355 [Candidatus Obscuribacterales bacterium]|nr:hypothetical protein [Candidatus Obscuribacterales bacterium]
MQNLSVSGSPQGPPSQDVSGQFLESLKVLIVVILVLGGQGAVLAYSSVLDWSKINDAGMLLHLLTTSWNGFLAGLINGTARSIQVVMAIWAGPTVWKYAAPVIGVTAAAMGRVMSSLAAMFKKTPPVETNGVVSQKEPTTI